jgi:serine/threonine protein kinase
MVNNCTTPPLEPPEPWPAEVRKLYEPVRILGVGGFASVALARLKQPSPTSQEGDERKKQQEEQPKLVAIKIAGSKYVTRADIGYAHREIDILKEIHHPNIMKLIDYWEPSPKELKCAAVIALSYEQGPSVEALLRHGGSLSLTFCRVVMAQLIDAVAFLHSKAVVHRDIKPDNVIVTGAYSTDDIIWDDDCGDKVEPDWQLLRKKWHVTLIDFGFARALTPEDVTKPSRQLKRENLDASYHTNDKSSNLDEGLNRSRHSIRQLRKDSSSKILNSSSHGSKGGDRLDLSSSGHRSLDRSISRTFQRKMSALGNRNFAAPEIINHVERNNEQPSSSESSEIDVTETLSQFVSGYGLLVDAYSMGCTFRYMITGVRPNLRVEDVIAAQNSCGSLILDWLAQRLGKRAKSPGARKVHYRRPQDLPPEVTALIKGMMEKATKTRTSVRAARRYPWIQAVLSPKGADGGCDDHDDEPKELSFLQCALKHSTLPIAKH